MDFKELLKISTVGPSYLRLNQDILRLIKQHMDGPRPLLTCNVCCCTLIQEVNDNLVMSKSYFTDIKKHTHSCYNCSRYKNTKKSLTPNEIRAMCIYT